MPVSACRYLTGGLGILRHNCSIEPITRAYSHGYKTGHNYLEARCFVSGPWSGFLQHRFWSKDAPGCQRQGTSTNLYDGTTVGAGQSDVTALAQMESLGSAAEQQDHDQWSKVHLRPVNHGSISSGLEPFLGFHLICSFIYKRLVGCKVKNFIPSYRSFPSEVH